jgi:Flp pilus assembly pilin Flp
MLRFKHIGAGDIRGVTTVEYALIAFVFLLFGMLAVANVGVGVESLFARSTAALTGAMTAAVGGSNAPTTLTGSSSARVQAQDENGNVGAPDKGSENSQALAASSGMSGWEIAAIVAAIAAVMLLGLVAIMPAGRTSQVRETTNYREAASFLKSDPRGGAGSRPRQAGGGEPVSTSALDAANDDRRELPQENTAARPDARLAVVRGNADAEYELGLRYAEGVGVAPDQAEALRRYRIAAALGHSAAQHCLGQYYKHGQDYLQAYKWFELSAANATCLEDRSRAQSSRGWIAAMMTPAQIAEAQKLAQEWRPAAA